MTKTIVNLALNAVISETEEILETYPCHPHQQAFSAPELRQKLFSYVLSRIPGMYAVVDDAEVSVPNSFPTFIAPEQRQHLQTIIQEGIHQLLNQDSDWVSRHIPEEVNASQSPSCWFG